MIAEGGILLGVKHLEQRRTWVALIVAAQLVDFVNQNQAVAAARLNQRVDDAPRHSADIRSAVAADIGFVPHAAQRKACVLTSHTAGDRPRHRSFSDTRRTDQTKNLPFNFPRHAFDSEKFQNTLFDLFQAIVI